MKKSTFFLMCLSTAVLCSCEGETTWIKQIDNQSNHDITILYDDGLHGGRVTKVVDAHSSEVIFYGEKTGGDETAVPCLDFLNELQVGLDSGVVLTKNILVEDNWDYSTTEKNLGGVVSQTCRFVVKNDDFIQ